MVTIWKWLSGKKLIIAGLYWSVLIPALQIFYPDGTPKDVQKWVGLIGFVLTFMGLGHKATKGIAEGVKKGLPLLALAVVVGMTSGCSKKVTQIDTFPDSQPAKTNQESPVLAFPSEPAESSQSQYQPSVVLREAVYFDLDSRVLSERAVRFLEGLKANGLLTGAQVSLYGACCPLGTDKYNLWLGEKRATSVGEFLGVPCQVESWGESEEHLVSSSPENYWKNRRVEIEVVK
jgi:peptidoglycan-associated lipoprotein